MDKVIKYLNISAEAADPDTIEKNIKKLSSVKDNTQLDVSDMIKKEEKKLCSSSIPSDFDFKGMKLIMKPFVFADKGERKAMDKAVEDIRQSCSVLDMNVSRDAWDEQMRSLEDKFPDKKLSE